MSKKFKYLKVLGERNCGTNYLEQLWVNNFQVEILKGNPHRRFPLKRKEWSLDLYFALTQRINLGWKHAMAPPETLIKNHKNFNQVALVALVKNPYSFLLSLHKRPYQFIGIPAESFDEFLGQSWKTTRKERWKKGYFNSPIDLWNQKTGSYLSLEKTWPDNVLVLKYEDLIKDPRASLEDIGRKFGLPLKDFQNVETSTKNDSGRSFDSYKDYYLEEKWRADLDNEKIDRINKSLDPSILQSLGYELIKFK